MIHRALLEAGGDAPASAPPLCGWRATLLVVVAALAVSAPSFRNGFVYDDHAVVGNEAVQSGLSGLGEVVRQDPFGDPGFATGLYRPVAGATFALEWWLHGGRAVAFHGVQVALYVLCALLLYRLMLRATASARFSFIAALLFAIHPVHSEVVNNLAFGRAEMLAFLFQAGAALLWLAAAGRPRRSILPCLGVAILAGLACLAKESAVMLPVLLAAWAFGRPTSRIGRAGVWNARASRLSIVAAGIGVIAAIAIRSSVAGPIGIREIHPIDNPVASSPAGVRCATAVYALARYVQLAVFPVTLSADYSFAAVEPIETLADPRFGVALLVLGLVSLVAVRVWRSSRAMAFPFLLFALAILPASNFFIPVGVLLAERLLFVPSVGVCLAFAYLFDRALASAPGLGEVRRPPVVRPAVAAVVLGIVLLTGGVRSIRRSADWRDDLALIRATLEAAPRSAKVHRNLGSFLAFQGDWAAAERHFLRSLEIAPLQIECAEALAQCRQTLALREYQAWELGSSVSDSIEPLALARRLREAGLPRPAIELLERATASGRGDAAAECALVVGQCRLSLGDPRVALVSFELAREGGADPVECERGIGACRVALGDWEGGREAFRRAIATRPSDASLRDDLGCLLAQAGRLTEAEPLFHEAYRLDPENPSVLNNLGMVAIAHGSSEEADALFRRALKSRPDFRPARENLLVSSQHSERN